MRKRKIRPSFQIFTTQSAQLIFKISPKLAQSCSGGTYLVGGVTSTHEVEKHHAATEEKVAQFRR